MPNGNSEDFTEMKRHITFDQVDSYSYRDTELVKVLVVNDEPMILMILEQMLKDNCHI